MDAWRDGDGPGELDRVWRRRWPHVARAEARQRSRQYLRGLVSAVERKNGWQLAEAVGEPTPYGIQELLNRAMGDADGVRDELRAYVTEHLGDPAAVLVVAETGFLKKGPKSVGVQRQSSGTAGRIENCQLGVFLVYAAPTGHAFLDRARSLPQSWADDGARRDEAGVPAEIGFQTKPQLARAMLERAVAAGVPFRWVTGDELYGGDRRLRMWLEARDLAHVLAVKRTEPPWAATARGPAQVAAADLIAALPAAAWTTLSAGEGAKGPRTYDWARVAIRPLADSDRGYWLLARRSLSEPTDLAYYVCFGAATTALAELARMAGSRWVIEQCLEEAKGEVGLDQDEVRRRGGWHRHITLCLLAQAILAVTRAAAEKGGAATTP